MNVKLMFLDCPGYLDEACTAICGLPAEVQCRWVDTSSSGPLESAKIQCPRGHWFSGTISALTWPKRRGNQSSDAVDALRPDAVLPARPEHGGD
jgi:hypothetical protein